MIEIELSLVQNDPGSVGGRTRGDGLRTFAERLRPLLADIPSPAGPMPPTLDRLYQKTKCPEITSARHQGVGGGPSSVVDALTVLVEAETNLNGHLEHADVCRARRGGKSANNSRNYATGGLRSS